jgi:ABC-type antimicrobial peptide transport system permease subunit
VALVMYLFATAKMTEDYFHENADEIFLIHQVTLEDNQDYWWGHTPRPLGPELENTVPEIVRAVRVAQTRVTILKDDDELGASVRFVDPEFFDMFTFPLASGTASAMSNNGEVMLSSEASIRFFGEEDPIGQTLSLRLANVKEIELTVTGLAKPFPSNTDFKFEMLMSYSAANAFDLNSTDDWSTYTAATFIQLKSSADAEHVEQILDGYTDHVNAISEDWQITGFVIDNLKMLTRHRTKVSRTVAGGMFITPIIVLSLVAFLLLLLSCLNYMNITIATSTRRLKEIGVRKVVGGNRYQLVLQFLVENVELCAFSLFFGIWIAWQFLVPAFNGITGLNLEFSLFRDTRLWMFLVMMVVGTGLISGAYPALYISSFRPTTILKGRQQLGRKRPITQSFLTFQFMLAFITLLGGIVFTMNNQYHLNRDLGYQTDHTLVFQVENEAELNFIQSAAQSIPGILSVSSSQHAIGRSENAVTALVGETEDTAILFGGSSSYLSLLEIPLNAGQLFDDVSGHVGSEGAIINETFADRFGLENPLGEFITLDSTNYAVVGVVKDFHYDDFFSNILPAVFVLAPESEHRFVSMKVQPGSGVSAATHIEEEFKSAFSSREANYYFQDETFQYFYEESTGILKIFSFVAILALLITCLSIYALSAQNLVNRLKEIGVRKVLGGSSLGIAQLVNKKFVFILTAAALLSAPLGYLGLNALLDDIYAYRMELNVMPFLLTYFVIIATAAVTVSTQVRSINRARPADIMRNE